MAEITEKTLDKFNDNALYKTLGIRIEKAGDGKARSVLRPPAEVCWPWPARPHGGVLFTLMDTTMAWAIFSYLERGYNCTTINMDIQYISPAKGPRFHCSTYITQRTNRLSFVRGEISGEEGRLIAAGQATFRIIRDETMEWE